MIAICATAAAGITRTAFSKARPGLDFGHVVDYLWMPLLLSAAMMAILVLILPNRRARVFGPRRLCFPLVWSGKTLIGCGLASAASRKQ